MNKRTIVVGTTLAATLFVSVGTAGAAVPVGPGPTGTYVVEPQPSDCHYQQSADGQTLPDSRCTPGATNPKVTPDTLDSTICKSGYTRSIRPPVSITDREKALNAKSYDYTGALSAAEYDHLIPLEVGGDPNDPRNLWVEPGASPNAKDSVENRLHQLVCARTVSLRAAQEAIATDWTTALAKVGG
ncbi:hypothetical protein IU500_07620 [Nocardia terpenica]|uniref:hypothetical protein n=1 Tax=Nocardia terpenica TaxID=455432 RepID=UPI001895379C|nr:hypothetical protein [Nocardia terpenica]MBF6060645.1 hypothetical protein [Nocardia terpenica]MBF6103905.1 hypothetical protein [Nocardia terpenica]MBF6111721.1 hypothetical protein [Nocardia terpenica]MBF6118126.1 hypothetical protein [Nocardia terpenica]MBF6156480.1 hypothetical protein [Nocardia terpenica]